MLKTGCTYAILPGVSRKPAELAGGLTMDYSVSSLPETTDFIDNTGRIKKSMQVAVIYRYSLLVRGDRRTAGAAQY